MKAKKHKAVWIQRHRIDFYGAMRVISSLVAAGGIGVMVLADSMKNVPMTPETKMLFFCLLGITMMAIGIAGYRFFRGLEIREAQRMNRKRARERQLQSGA